MSLTPLPPSPDRNMDEEEFVQTSDVFVTALPVMVSEINLLQSGLNAIAAGGVFAIPYTFNTGTSDVDPGAGLLRLNNATQNLATVLRLDLVGADGITWTTLLDAMDDSTSVVKGYLKLVKSADTTKFIIFKLTALASPAGYRNATVTVVTSSSTNPFTNADSLILQFTPNGDLAAGTIPGITWLGGVDASASATIDLETTIDGTYDSYLIVAKGVVPASNATALWARLKIAGAYDAGASYYYHTSISASGSASYAGVVGAALAQIVVGNALSNVATATANFQLCLYTPNSSRSKTFTSVGQYMTTATALAQANCSGMNVGTGAVTGVRFMMSSGNITSGRFDLYGVYHA